LLQHPIALAMRILPVVTGLSVLGFAAAMLLKGEERRMPMTALTAALVGARECPGEAGAAAGGGEVKGER
jgi:hypothetical protein